MSELEYEKWRNLIGDFILEFANVENEVFGIFDDIGSEQDLNRAKAVLFKARVTEAIKLIDVNVPDPQLAKPVKRALNELVKLADEVRNLIAHNPVQLSLEGILTGSNEHEVRSIKVYDKAITFEQLQSSYVELQHWRSKLFDGTYHIRKKVSWERENSGHA